MANKYIDNSWDFRNADTKPLTHCFHNYPAMMIPQIANRLIEKYGKNATLLFDPYCGTGTSLVEANVKNINAIGTDLNPLARLIAKAKTTPINIHQLDLIIKDFNDKTFMMGFGINNSVILPTFKNIDYWFTKEHQHKLALIKDYITQITDPSIQQFFKVAFSETVREVSLTRNSEFKLFKMSPRQLEKFNPDVFGIMESKLFRNRKGLLSFMEMKPSMTNVYSFNTVHGIPNTVLSENSVDLIVTSPPYGDSRTTVAYGQFSRLANQWLGYENASKVDNDLMGGKRTSGFHHLIIDEIAQKDNRRAKEVVAFYKDYNDSINNISKVIKKGGTVCYVVGNRRVKGITLPTDKMTQEMFQANGFEQVETIIRNIPNKRMPSQNSPSNKMGQLETTMTKEYIIVMEKVKR